MNNLSKQILKLIAITALVVGAIYINDLISTDNIDSETKSYYEQILTIEEKENANPIQFIVAEGKYNSSFWGTKLKIRGEIKNKATVAEYKDIKLRITYYSKTNSVLTTKDYTLYEIYPPNSITPFKLDIDNFKDVKSIDWNVISALEN